MHLGVSKLRLRLVVPNLPLNANEAKRSALTRADAALSFLKVF